ncbi:MAG: DUF433 domain-containing protein [Ferruginibacter sp.]|nr:DUF433 domain-containing protein [Ferruginibacter sp.]
MMSVNQFIVIDKSIRFGKPTVKGTRISVADVLNWLAEGMTIKEIIEDFPQLNAEQIKACLKYAASKESKLAVA